VAVGAASDAIQKTLQLPVGRGLCGWVAANDEPLRVEDAYADPRFDPTWDRETGFTTRSVLCVPLRVRGELIGVGEVINRRDGKPFTPADQSLFTTFCQLAAVAIQNARLQASTLYKERMERDLAAAREVQASFLPAHMPRAPGFRFEAAERPALGVGGDLYDLFALPDNAIALTIGDVSGKGMPAALQMARLMSDLRLAVAPESAPGELLAFVGRALSARSILGMHATMIYGVLETATGRVTIANAGHPPALRVRAGRAKEVAAASGPPLGFPGTPQYMSETVPLSSGDALVAFTDGLTEVRDADDRPLGLAGLARLCETLEPLRHGFLDRLVAAVEAHAAPHRPHDDLTALLVVREP
jgi:sigma-B regulation protein RsbU (phosphoserine phosphatase)